MALVEKIISGGQTGADRGGLNAAIALRISHGGWCPKGRRAEDGKVPKLYRLRETSAANYQSRTRWNVLEADGTVIFSNGPLAAGSALTARVARDAGKPYLHLDVKRLGRAQIVEQFRAWITRSGVQVLNVAGSRESLTPGIQSAVAIFLKASLSAGRRRYATEEEVLGLDAPAELAVAEEAPRYGATRQRSKTARRQPQRARRK